MNLQNPSCIRKQAYYLEQGVRLVPTTRLVMLRTVISSRIALVVILLSRSTVSTVTCQIGGKKKKKCSHHPFSGVWCVINCHLATECRILYLGLITQADIFLQEIPPPVMLFIYVNSGLFFAQLAL